MKVGLERLAPVAGRVILDLLDSLVSKVHQAGKEMLEHQEILEHRVRMVSRDLRVWSVNQETPVPRVMLDGLEHQDHKARLDNEAHKVVTITL